MATSFTKQIKKMTVSAMLCALSLIFLSIGAVIDVLDLTLAAVAAICIFYAVIEIGGAYPWMIWLVTTTLGFLLPIQKSPVIVYACFAGIYPILKSKFEKLPKAFSWLLKLLSLHVGIGLSYLLCRLFFVSLIEDMALNLILFITYLLAVVVFVIYDIAMTGLITMYYRRFQKILGIKNK